MFLHLEITTYSLTMSETRVFCCDQDGNVVLWNLPGCNRMLWKCARGVPGSIDYKTKTVMCRLLTFCSHQLILV